MTAFKKSINRILGSEPLVSLSLKIESKNPLVILYHGVSGEETHPGIENYRGKHIPKRAFENQIIFLQKHFTIVTLDSMEKVVAQGMSLQKPLCAITFDDGYKNNFIHAFPILKKYEVPATIFVTVGFIEGNFLWPDRLEYTVGHTKKSSLLITLFGVQTTFKTDTREERIKTDDTLRSFLKKLNSHDRETFLSTIEKELGCALTPQNAPLNYLPLSKQDLQTLGAEGVSIGAHTVNHPILSRLTPEEQKEEISSSFEYVKNITGNCHHFAYPNGQKGDWNKDTEKILSELRCRFAWSTEARRIETQKERNFLALPRVTMDNGHLQNRFEALVSGTINRAKKLLHT